MRASDLISALQAVSHTFGARAAKKKVHLLGELEEAGPLAVAELVALQDVIGFLRAYPDDAAVRRAAVVAARLVRRQAGAQASSARGLRNSGLPGTAMSYAYSYGTLAALVRAWPGSCEIDWDSLDDDDPLLQALIASVPPAEADGLEDERLTLREWLAGCRPRGVGSDLETALAVIAGSGHDERLQVRLFEAGEIPARYALRRRGQGRCEVALRGGRVHWQRAAVERTRFPLPPRIRAPLPAVRPLGVAAAREVLAVALAAMCARRLEIYPLIHANDRDVLRVPCERGIEVVLVGTRPPFRAALESLYCFLVVKNGVPVGYGPAGVFLGACELGINLFEEFRGGEIRVVYAQVMRVLHHVLGAEYFYVQPYGMGEGNPAAIASGAFWFYRKLGFAAENPAVERLARAEEERMRADPGHRSSRRTLRRLQHTRVSLDLGSGRSRPFDFARLGVRVAELVGRRHGGDRARAAVRCASAVARALEVDLGGWSKSQQRALADVAPILAMVRDLARWTPGERRALARALRLKGGASEAPACRALARHARLRGALRELVAG